MHLEFGLFKTVLYRQETIHGSVRSPFYDHSMMSTISFFRDQSKSLSGMRCKTPDIKIAA